MSLTVLRLGRRGEGGREGGRREGGRDKSKRVLLHDNDNMLRKPVGPSSSWL